MPDDKKEDEQNKIKQLHEWIETNYHEMHIVGGCHKFVFIDFFKRKNKGAI